MLNSIKQICRTPIKLAGLLISIMAGTMLLVLGMNLISHTNAQLDMLENSYTTIGMVEQEKSATEIGSVWDSSLRTYQNYRGSVYDEILSEEMLNFKGADYVVQPEKRKYYGAYMPEYLSSTSNKATNLNLILEFVPEKTCIPDKPVPVNVKKVLMGEIHGNNRVYVCDHMTEKPKTLEVGKTYIAVLAYRKNTHEESQKEVPEELHITQILPTTTQCDKRGNLYESSMNNTNGRTWEEVTDDFYETERGKQWLNLVKAYETFEKTFPVLPTNSLNLLPTFHDKQSNIVSGREISKKEFEQGKQVCIISKEFGDVNNLQIGDKIKIPLYFADYNNPSSVTFGQMYSFSLFNAKGETYPVFAEEEYEIVGMYQYQNISGNVAAEATEAVADQIIIPTKSVKESDENNIVSVGPMRNATTSFQIPNGTADVYERGFSKVAKSDFLHITFDDNGYAKIKQQLDESRITAYMLCGIGFLAVVVIVLLLLYFFVIRQKKRLAIERAIGAGKRQCKISMIGGMTLFVLVAAILGSAIGTGVSGKLLQKESKKESYFSTDYSVQKETEENIPQGELKTEMMSVETAAILVITPIGITIIVVLVSLYLINRQLKMELVILLGDREN